MATDILVPTLGESVSVATVARWLKQAGETVAADEPLVELETDKVTVEVNAPAAGVIESIAAAQGAEVVPGALLGSIAAGGVGTVSAASGVGSAPAPAPAAAPASVPVATPIAAPMPVAAAPAPVAASGMADLLVPTLGESVAIATVARWLKQPGEPVAADEPLVELETDKVTVEVNAPAAGVLQSQAAAQGSEVAPGALLGRIATGAGAPAAPKLETPRAVLGPVSRPGGLPADAGAPAAAAPPAAAPASGPAHAPMPAAAKLLAEAKLAPAALGAGTGKDGRITKGDVLEFLARPAPAPAPAAAKPARALEPGEERVKMTRLRITIARRLKEAQNTAAMLTTFNEVDMGAAMALRTEYRDAFEKKHGVRLGFMSFFVKAAVAALKEFPAVNAELEGDEVIYKHFVHMGVAVGGPNGLVVPVLRNADQLGFAGIEKGIGDFGKRVRDGQLKLEEMTGGSFTITNGGVYGSLMSTPILNPPQSGILGMHKIQDRPMAVAGKVEVRPMMYLALSYDHRIVDGKEAVSFLVRVKEAIEDPRRLLLDL